MPESPVYSPERGVGSNQFEIHTAVLNFDDPDLLTGIALWTPVSVGELVYGQLSFMDITAGFDGTTPRLLICPASDLAEVIVSTTAINITDGGRDYVQSFIAFTDVHRVLVIDPIVAIVDDGAAGAVGGTAGSVRVTLVTCDPLDFVVAE